MSFSGATGPNSACFTPSPPRGSDSNGYCRRIRVGASGAPDSPPRRAPDPPSSGQTAPDGNSPTVSAMEQGTGIAALYAEFFQGYRADFRPVLPGIPLGPDV